MSHLPSLPVKPSPDNPAPDWGAKAVLAAEHTADRYFFAPRGAFVWAPGVVALFGNDGRAPDGRGSAEVEAVRRRLAGAGAHELGFGVAVADGSWALLVSVEGAEYQGARPGRLLGGTLFDVVWDAWQETHGRGAARQRALAREQVG
jgi:hypothetical protein